MTDTSFEIVGGTCSGKSNGYCEEEMVSGKTVVSIVLLGMVSFRLFVCRSDHDKRSNLYGSASL